MVEGARVNYVDVLIGISVSLVGKAYRLACFVLAAPTQSIWRESPDQFYEPQQEGVEDRHPCISTHLLFDSRSISSQSGYEELRRLAALRGAGIAKDRSIPRHCLLSGEGVVEFPRNRNLPCGVLPHTPGCGRNFRYRRYKR